jgi:hypothetical protein
VANVNVNKSGSPLDGLDNPVNSELLDYVKATREYKPAAERLDWRVELVRALALLVSLAVAWGLFGIWRWGYCLDAGNYLRCDRIDALQPVGAFLAVLLVVGLPAWRVAVWAWGELLMARARAARTATTFDRFGNPQRVDLVLPLAEAAARYRLDIDLKRATAPYEWAHSINTYSPSNTAPPALPAPEAGLQLVPDAEWLPWLVEQPHTMIAGGTGAGKTTLARVALAERLRAGYSAIVLDPKGKDWGGLPVYGGGRDFEAILSTLEAIRLEMAQRFTAYNRGERDFEPIVVLVDEVPDIMDSCLSDSGRLVDPRWRRFARSLGSLAREVQISVLLLTQSPLVEDIGINSAMRKNYCRLALGDEALPLIRNEEPDPKRKPQLVALLRDLKYPAALYRAGAVFLLDTSNVPALAERGFTPQGWQPSVLLDGEPVQQGGADGRGRTDGPDGGQHSADAMRETLVVSLKRAGRNREEIRQELQQLGLGLTNGEYTAILARHGLV